MSRTYRTSEEAYFEDDIDDNNQPEDSKFVQRKAMASRFLEKARQQGSTTLATGSTEGNGDTEKTDQEDPLDLFMADINRTIGEQNAETVEETTKAPSSSSFWEGNEVCEEEDLTADYLREAAIKAAAAKPKEESEDDEEEDEDRPRGATSLPPVDHSTIKYEVFQKNIYKEHADVTSMTIEDCVAYKKSRQITVQGYQVPQAVSTFSHLAQTLEKGLSTNIRHQGWETPTPIQSQAIPIALCGRDLLAIAATGSGKTGAYLIPLIQHVCKVLDQWKIAQMPSHGGPLALVVCPTRELALQIYDITQALSTNLRLRVSCFCGGYDKTQQFKEINRGIEICIGNPGRLIDLATMKGGLKIKDITFLVLDEADRMLDMGFVTEVLSLARGIRPDRQTLMFSATMPSNVEKLAVEVTLKAVRLTIGTEGQASSLIEQRVIVFRDEQRKADWIVNNIHKLTRWDRQVLVFCNSHGRVLDLAAVINDVLNNSPNPFVSDIQRQQEEEPEVEEERIREEVHTESPTTVLAPAFARLSRNLCDSVSSRQDTLGMNPHVVLQSGLVNEVSETIVGQPTIANHTTISSETTVTKQFARALYGDMNQGERMEVTNGFRKKKFQVLVATDVAARGLDIPNISIVVSYDAPQTEDLHIHRIGRTGRAGIRGTAYTFLTRNENRMAGFIVESMEVVGQHAPKQLVQLAMTYQPFKTAKLSGRSYSAHMKLKKTQNKEEQIGLSSVGIGFAKSESEKPLTRWQGSFVSSAESSISSSINEPLKRRWDSTPGSVSNAIPAQQNPVGITPPVPTIKNPPKRQRNIPVSGQTASSTLHVESTTITANSPKVFGPNDEISSSDDDETKPLQQNSAQISSLLNLQKRNQRTSQNQLVEAQQRAFAAAQKRAVAVALSKGTSDWDPSAAQVSDVSSQLWGQLQSKSTPVSSFSRDPIETQDLTETTCSKKSRWN